MTLTEVCKELGVSRNTAYARIDDGTLKPLEPIKSPLSKLPRYRFNRADVEALKSTPPPPPPKGE